MDVTIVIFEFCFAHFSGVGGLKSLSGIDPIKILYDLLSFTISIMILIVITDEMKYSSSLLSGIKLPTGEAASQFKDSQNSDILAGNLDQVFSFSSDESDDSSDESLENRSVFVDAPDLTNVDLRKVDEIIHEKLGIRNTMKHFIAIVLSGELSVTDILVQALVYRVRILSQGKRSVRFSDSYGMFWAGVRNIVKTRGLVVFREHFPIPTCLSTMKKKVIQKCQLDPISLGKSGLQKQNIEIWIKSKQTEIAPKQLCVSIAADAKKISASTEGQEDLSGLGGRETTSDEWKRHESNKKDLLCLLKTVDINRQSCYAIYDKLTTETAQIVSKLECIDKLRDRNSKLLLKNPSLAKYIYVLEEQMKEGTSLLVKAQSVQQALIYIVSRSRKCVDFFMASKSSVLDLGSQPNYYCVSTHSLDMKLCEDVKGCISSGTKRIDVDWEILNPRISVPPNLVGLESKSCEILLSLCYLRDDDFFQACGLRKQRPVADMRDIYNHAWSQPEVVSIQEPLDCTVRASFLTNFSIMSFGRNRVTRDGGLFIDNGICSLANLVILSDPETNDIEYTVKAFNVESQPFIFSEDQLVSALACATIANVQKGCLLVLHSRLLCVVFEIQRNDVIVGKMKNLIQSYVRNKHNITKRTKEMISLSLDIQVSLESIAKQVTTIGSYPYFGEVCESTGRASMSDTNILRPNLRVSANVVEVDKVL